MSSSEEELQKNIEADRLADDGRDSIAYKHVFNALDRWQENTLPVNFADKIIVQIVREERRAERRDLLWFGVGTFFILVIFISTILYTGFSFNLGFLKNMSPYTGLFVFGCVFIFGLHLLDKRIMKTRYGSR
jgi:hypothetical protein